VKSKSGRAMAGATVFAAAVPVGATAPLGQSEEAQVRTYLDTLRSMRPVPTGCASAATDADGAFALTVGANDTYFVFAWADGCDMHVAAGSSVKDVRAGATVDFVASDQADVARTAVDPSASEGDRIAALRVLRGVRGGITPEVATSMIELLRTSSDASIRRDVIRNLHHCGDPGLKAALIDALHGDADEGVREQAAKDIDEFAGEQIVREALEKARDSDASEKVRSEAAKTLASRGR
jgi:HEAT repeat protein